MFLSREPSNRCPERMQWLLSLLPAGGRRQVVINIKVALFQLELTREKMLRHALAAVNEYVAEDSLFAASEFPKLVGAEVQNIFVIVRNKVNMYAYHDDIDTLVDMHHHIAQSAMNTPDLRLATLATIQTFHAKVRVTPAQASATGGPRVNALAVANEEAGAGYPHSLRKGTGPSSRSVTCTRPRCSPSACTR